MAISRDALIGIHTDEADSGGRAQRCSPRAGGHCRLTMLAARDEVQKARRV